MFKTVFFPWHTLNQFLIQEEEEDRPHYSKQPLAFEAAVKKESQSDLHL